MTPGDVEIVQSQFEELAELATTEGIVPVAQILPLSLAREFARKLILCPDEDAAKRLLRRDQEQLQAFLQAAMTHDLETLAAIEGFGDDDEGNTPFYELCVTTMRVIDQVERDFPELM